MESKNFAKVIETKEKDFLVQKVNSEDEFGVKITTQEKHYELTITISVERIEDINPLYDNITVENVKETMNEFISKDFAKSEEE
jgi:hypothetical protein